MQEIKYLKIINNKLYIKYKGEYPLELLANTKEKVANGFFKKTEKAKAKRTKTKIIHSGITAKDTSRNRQEFLLKYFFTGTEDKYLEIKVMDYILTKYYDNNTGNWNVAIYTKEAFDKCSKYLKKHK